MNHLKNIADLLEEVQAVVHTLQEEKTDLYDKVNVLEAQLSLMKEEKAKEGGNLQEINMQLRKDLQDMKTRFASELQDRKARHANELQEIKDRCAGELQKTQQKLDRFHPELQTLQNEFQNAELQNNLLEIELSKKDEEIKALEDHLNSYTSLAFASLPVEEPIA